MIQDATPAGYESFCLRFHDQRTARVDARRFCRLMRIWSALTWVNAKVNDEIYPESDQHHQGRLEFSKILTDGYGDCEDFALTKRRDLTDEGFSEAALRIAVVLTSWAERHAVLTVTTDKGDYVLDSLAQDIRPQNNTDYTWIERQDPQLGWVSMRASRILLANNVGPTAAVKQPAGRTFIRRRPWSCAGAAGAGSARTESAPCPQAGRNSAAWSGGRQKAAP